MIFQHPFCCYGKQNHKFFIDYVGNPSTHSGLKFRVLVQFF